MTWLPTDHRLGVCHVDERGAIDPSRPIADIDVVRMALDGAYTVVHDPATGQRAIMLGLRSPPLASRLMMTLASGTSSNIHGLSFRRGDLAWAAKAVLGTSSLVAAEAVPILSAEPTVWLEANWPAVAAALARPHELVPAPLGRGVASAGTTRWAVRPSGDPSRNTSESRLGKTPAWQHEVGDLTWAVLFVADEEADEDAVPASAVAPGPGQRRRHECPPWWDLGAWYFGNRHPRI